jgi:hypothetical protein
MFPPGRAVLSALTLRQEGVGAFSLITKEDFYIIADTGGTAQSHHEESAPNQSH